MACHAAAFRTRTGMITKSRKEMEKLTNIRRFFRISLSIQGLYHKAKPWGEIIFQEEILWNC
jgi:hypothetical protein